MTEIDTSPAAIAARTAAGARRRLLNGTVGSKPRKPKDAAPAARKQRVRPQDGAVGEFERTEKWQPKPRPPKPIAPGKNWIEIERHKAQQRLSNRERGEVRAAEARRAECERLSAEVRAAAKPRLNWKQKEAARRAARIATMSPEELVKFERRSAARKRQVAAAKGQSGPAIVNQPVENSICDTLDRPDSKMASPAKGRHSLDLVEPATAPPAGLAFDAIVTGADNVQSSTSPQ